MIEYPDFLDVDIEETPSLSIYDICEVIEVFGYGDEIFRLPILMNEKVEVRHLYIDRELSTNTTYDIINEIENITNREAYISKELSEKAISHRASTYLIKNHTTDLIISHYNYNKLKTFSHFAEKQGIRVIFHDINDIILYKKSSVLCLINKQTNKYTRTYADTSEFLKIELI